MTTPLWINWVKTNQDRWDTDCGQFACVRRPTGVWYVLSVLPDGEFAERVTPYGTSLRVLGLARTAVNAMKEFDRYLTKKEAHRASLAVMPPAPRQDKSLRRVVSLGSLNQTLKLPSPLNPQKNMWEAVFKPRVQAKLERQGVVRACVLTPPPLPRPVTSLADWRAKKERSNAHFDRPGRDASRLVAALA